MNQASTTESECQDKYRSSHWNQRSSELLQELDNRQVLEHFCELNAACLSEMLLEKMYLAYLNENNGKLLLSNYVTFRKYHIRLKVTAKFKIIAVINHASSAMPHYRDAHTISSRQGLCRSTKWLQMKLKGNPVSFCFRFKRKTSKPNIRNFEYKTNYNNVLAYLLSLPL